MNLTNRIAQLTSHADVDALLGRVGLQRTPTFTARVLPALGLFSGGLVIGMGAGLLLAPTSGKELRANIQKKSVDLLQVLLRLLTPEQATAEKSDGNGQERDAPARAKNGEGGADGNGARPPTPTPESDRTLVMGARTIE